MDESLKIIIKNGPFQGHKHIKITERQTNTSHFVVLNNELNFFAAFFFYSTQITHGRTAIKKYFHCPTTIILKKLLVSDIFIFFFIKNFEVF